MRMKTHIEHQARVLRRAVGIEGVERAFANGQQRLKRQHGQHEAKQKNGERSSIRRQAGTDEAHQRWGGHAGDEPDAKRGEQTGGEQAAKEPAEGVAVVAHGAKRRHEDAAQRPAEQDDLQKTRRGKGEHKGVHGRRGAE